MSPSAALAPVADLLVALGLVLGAAAWWSTRSWGQALGVTLDLVLAASLLRLTGEPGWAVLGTTAAVVAVRTVLRRSLAADRRTTARADAATRTAAPS